MSDETKNEVSCTGLVYICTKMAHQANLTYGIFAEQVVEGYRWIQLSKEDQNKKIETFDKIASQTEQPHLDAPYLHYLWLKTAPTDHLCNKPWGELTPEQQFKDHLYLSFINLYKSLCYRKGENNDER